MFATMGWVLLAGLPLASSIAIDSSVSPPVPRFSSALGRVVVWADRDDPYRRGDGARVYLSSERPAHLAVFRVDTDGRIRVLFPREPWGDTYVRSARKFEVTGDRGGRSFVVDDYPGVGYLFAIASSRRFDFEDIVRGDHWDYRLIEGGRIQGDPYAALTDLAERIARGADYTYDINPYYVERHYEYPRFVCYDCHAYAKYDEWDPYDRACTKFRVVIYDDPRYYPYRSGRGRNIVVERPARLAPRYVFRDADPRREYVTRVKGGGALEYRRREDGGRTSRDIGGRGSVPAPAISSPRDAPRMAPPLRAVPSRPPIGRDTPLGDDRERTRRRQEPATPQAVPKRLQPTDDNRRRAPPINAKPEPQSTGEPELRRRKP
jgi:Domain of unknown function (DUF4384)